MLLIAIQSFWAVYDVMTGQDKTELTVWHSVAPVPDVPNISRHK